MIFIRNNGKFKSVKVAPDWRVLATFASVDDYPLTYYHYRIGSVVYETDNKEFRKAYEREKIIETLTGRYCNAGI